MARTPVGDALTPLADRAVAPEEEESPWRMAGLAEVVAAMAADLRAGVTPAEVTDAVLVQTPAEWGEESWRLLGLAGLALWPWPAWGSQSENAQAKLTSVKGLGRSFRWKDYLTDRVSLPLFDHLPGDEANGCQGQDPAQ